MIPSTDSGGDLTPSAPAATRRHRVPVLSVASEIAVPAARAYEVIADYREGHPSILPKPPFVSLHVEEGGRGAGTRIRVEMKVAGRRQSYRAVVTEPVPGRTLVESNDTGYETSFTVEPLAERRCRVTISTDMERGGFLAALERRLVARMLRAVYEREIELLAGVAGRGQRPVTDER